MCIRDSDNAPRSCPPPRLQDVFSLLSCAPCFPRGCCPVTVTSCLRQFPPPSLGSGHSCRTHRTSKNDTPLVMLTGCHLPLLRSRSHLPMIPLTCHFYPHPSWEFVGCYACCFLPVTSCLREWYPSPVMQRVCCLLLRSRTSCSRSQLPLCLREVVVWSRPLLCNPLLITVCSHGHFLCTPQTSYSNLYCSVASLLPTVYDWYSCQPQWACQLAVNSAQSKVM